MTSWNKGKKGKKKKLSENFLMLLSLSGFHPEGINTMGRIDYSFPPSNSSIYQRFPTLLYTHLNCRLYFCAAFAKDMALCVHPTYPAVTSITMYMHFLPYSR